MNGALYEAMLKRMSAPMQVRHASSSLEHARFARRNGMMTKPCEWCKTVFEFKASRLGRVRFCSRRCLGLATGANAASGCRPPRPGDPANPWLRTPEWTAWASMRWRCYNPRHRHYSSYGGRGILVCDRWLGSDGFKNFLADLGPRPSAKHSLDRVDNDKGYSPENCRWATSQEQNANRRSANNITIGEATKCAAEWARLAGISVGAIAARQRKGWVGEALLAPTRRRSQP